eukprot:scaffold249345_cov64-Cyclotella_meneghiniana.AAC.2
MAHGRQHPNKLRPPTSPNPTNTLPNVSATGGGVHVVNYAAVVVNHHFRGRGTSVADNVCRGGYPG